MQKPQFKVKIIGGKLVQVPDFNYVQEHNAKLGTIPGTKPYVREPETNSNHARKDPRGHELYSNAPKVRSRYSGLQDQNGSETTKHNNGKQSRVSKTDASYNQSMRNRLEAEKNRSRALKQLHESVLAPDPMQQDSDEEYFENDKDDTALSKQVAECLQNSNKQKIAFALRAMQRLDSKETGYISVRNFRDALLMYQIFIIGGTLEKLIEKYKSSAGKINYAKLWSFVTKSFDGSSSSPRVPNSDNPKVTKLQIAMVEIEQDFKAHAHNNHAIFDFTDLTKSLENCDRGRSNMIGLKEVRIICKYYLPVNHDNLEPLYRHCDVQKNGWINYRSLLQMLTDAQPTYLPPINNKRRGTFLLENKDSLLLTMENNRYQNNNNSINNSDAKNENNGLGNDALLSVTDKNNRLELNRDETIPPNEDRRYDVMGTSERGGRKGSFTLSPRRRWYESEESWRKRKRRTVRKPTRRRWEYSAPVKSLSDMKDSQNYKDSDGWSISSSPDHQSYDAGKDE